MFLQSLILIFDSFNIFPQSEEQMIHKLYHFILCLYCPLISRFVLPEVISESDDMLSFDLEIPNV